MIKSIYALLDKKAEYYMTPMFTRSENEAKRLLVSSMINVEELRTYADDYELCKIGEFDEKTGTLTPLSNPKFTMAGHEAKHVAEKHLKKKHQQEIDDEVMLRENDDRLNSIKEVKQA
jgi:uncharacterized protein YdiU (UPF0061 family)